MKPMIFQKTNQGAQAIELRRLEEGSDLSGGKHYPPVALKRECKIN